MTTKFKFIIATAFVVTLVGLGIGQAKLQQQAVAQEAAGKVAPAFEVDPFWPKPLPNHWILGNTIGVAVDSRDHVFIVHRDQDDIFLDRREIGLKLGGSECCAPAPPILEFDPEGNLVNAWGGPGEGYTWPASNHGIEVASNGNIWIGGNGSGDSHILVFSRDGKFLKQIGKPGSEVDSNSTEHFGRVAEIAIDPEAEEAYIADGYTHKRVAVLDQNSGDFKRFWGAYGNVPVDGRIRYNPDDEELPQQFVGPVHCAEPSKDGLVYVCDRGADRIQVFKTDGTFVTEKQILPQTQVQGSVWDIAFSKDPQQRYLFVADGQNHRVHILERESLEILTTFGDGGRQPGLFFAVHSIATDSKGNIYTTETYDGRRLQKFVFQGAKPVDKENRGAPWPADKL